MSWTTANRITWRCNATRSGFATVLYRASLEASKLSRVRRGRPCRPYHSRCGGCDARRSSRGAGPAARRANGSCRASRTLRRARKAERITVERQALARSGEVIREPEVLRKHSWPRSPNFAWRAVLRRPGMCFSVIRDHLGGDWSK